MAPVWGFDARSPSVRMWRCAGLEWDAGHASVPAPGPRVDLQQDKEVHCARRQINYGMCTLKLLGF